MFDFGSLGGGELLVIGIVALIVIGPKELPGMIRNIGRMMTKVRQMAFEFRSQFDEAMREAENATGKADLEKLGGEITSAAAFNPLDSLRKEIASAVDTVKGEAPVEPAAAAEISAQPLETAPPPAPLPAAPAAAEIPAAPPPAKPAA